MKVKIFAGLGVCLLLSLIFLSGVYAEFRVPEDDSRVRYFYVFGPQGDPLMGKEDSEQIIYIDVPENEIRNLIIKVYDPDVGGARDWRRGPEDEWDTTTEFAIYGKNLLDREVFAENRVYDRNYYRFGPYKKELGEKIDGYYRFRLEVKGKSGNDANLFSLRISPDSAVVFCYDITFRLLPREGDKMYFYFNVPQETKEITVENYDIDLHGGKSHIVDLVTGLKYKIKDSQSGQWTQTVIPLHLELPHQFEYRLIKGTQKYAHAGIRIKDDKGNYLPIYFRKRRLPVIAVKPAKIEKPIKPQGELACRTFTFDATKSYDPDNQALSFHWDFGDGTTSNKPVVTHIFPGPGEYTVTLTVTDSSGLEGCSTAKTQKVITVNAPPKPKFTAPDLVCPGNVLVFDASTTEDETPETLSYKWDFGDGTTADGKVVRKVYGKGGIYRVKLTVDDNQGTACSVSTVERIIRVNNPPVADAGEDVNLFLQSMAEEYMVKFDGRNSRDRDGDELSYTWDFGDGSSGKGERVTHIYHKGGKYKVTLEVCDGTATKCSCSRDSITVTLNKPPVAKAGKDIKTCKGSEITFDGSGSYTESGETLSYFWDFGDGSTARGEKVTHTYTRGGTYKVVLTVDDGQNAPNSRTSDVINVMVNSSPYVSLRAVEPVCVGTEVAFDASDSGDPDRDRLVYIWDFGDGTTLVAGAKVKHKYEKGGIYNVKVTVDDGKGTSCSKISDSIKLRVNTPPVADAGRDKVVCMGCAIVFDGTKSYDPDGDSLVYTWNFGDGATAEGAKVTHIYDKPGKYEVTLTVSDGSETPCNFSVDKIKVTVNAPPVPIIKVK